MKTFIKPLKDKQLEKELMEQLQLQKENEIENEFQKYEEHKKIIIPQFPSELEQKYKNFLNELITSNESRKKSINAVQNELQKLFYSQQSQSQDKSIHQQYNQSITFKNGSTQSVQLIIEKQTLKLENIKQEYEIQEMLLEKEMKKKETFQHLYKQIYKSLYTMKMNMSKDQNQQKNDQEDLYNISYKANIQQVFILLSFNKINQQDIVNRYKNDLLVKNKMNKQKLQQLEEKQKNDHGILEKNIKDAADISKKIQIISKNEDQQANTMNQLNKHDVEQIKKQEQMNLVYQYIKTLDELYQALFFDKKSQSQISRVNSQQILPEQDEKIKNINQDQYEDSVIYDKLKLLGEQYDDNYQNISQSYLEQNIKLDNLDQDDRIHYYNIQQQTAMKKIKDKIDFHCNNYPSIQILEDKLFLKLKQLKIDEGSLTKYFEYQIIQIQKQKSLLIELSIQTKDLISINFDSMYSIESDQNYYESQDKLRKLSSEIIQLFQNKQESEMIKIIILSQMHQTLHRFRNLINNLINQKNINIWSGTEYFKDILKKIEYYIEQTNNGFIQKREEHQFIKDYNTQQQGKKTVGLTAMLMIGIQQKIDKEFQESFGSIVKLLQFQQFLPVSKNDLLQLFLDVFPGKKILAEEWIFYIYKDISILMFQSSLCIKNHLFNIQKNFVNLKPNDYYQLIFQSIQQLQSISEHNAYLEVRKAIDLFTELIVLMNNQIFEKKPFIKNSEFSLKFQIDQAGLNLSKRKEILQKISQQAENSVDFRRINQTKNLDQIDSEISQNNIKKQVSDEIEIQEEQIPLENEIENWIMDKKINNNNYLYNPVLPNIRSSTALNPKRIHLSSQTSKNLQGILQNDMMIDRLKLIDKMERRQLNYQSTYETRSYNNEQAIQLKLEQNKRYLNYYNKNVKHKSLHLIKKEQNIVQVKSMYSKSIMEKNLKQVENIYLKQKPSTKGSMRSFTTKRAKYNEENQSGHYLMSQDKIFASKCQSQDQFTPILNQHLVQRNYDKRVSQTPLVSFRVKF